MNFHTLLGLHMARTSKYSLTPALSATFARRYSVRLLATESIRQEIDRLKYSSYFRYMNFHTLLGLHMARTSKYSLTPALSAATPYNWHARRSLCF